MEGTASGLFDERGWQQRAATNVHRPMQEAEASWRSVAAAACYSSKWDRVRAETRAQSGSLISMLNRQLL